MYPSLPRHHPLLGPGDVVHAHMPAEALASLHRPAGSALAPAAGGPAFCVDPSAPIGRTQCAPDHLIFFLHAPA